MRTPDMYVVVWRWSRKGTYSLFEQLLYTTRTGNDYTPDKKISKNTVRTLKAGFQAKTTVDFK
jgi:hypothetical protein